MSEAVASALCAPAGYFNIGRETVLAAAETDPRCAPEVIEACARRIAAAWTAAADLDSAADEDASGAGSGDEAGLAAVARPGVARLLLRPAPALPPEPRGPAGGNTRLMIRGLRVTGITIRLLRADERPLLLDVSVDETGRRWVEDRATGAVLSGDPDEPTIFMEEWQLALEGPADCPWLLAAGSTQTFEDLLGYTYRCRRETEQEYRDRAGALAPPPRAGAPARRWELRCGFVDHDVKFGSHASVVVELAAQPRREEAERLVGPAVLAEITRYRGQAEYQPSILRLEAIGLLEP